SESGGRPLLAAGGLRGDHRVFAVQRLPVSVVVVLRADRIRGESQLHQVQPGRVQELPLSSDGGTSLLEVRGGHVGSDGGVRRGRGHPSALARPPRLREGPAPDRVHLGHQRHTGDTPERHRDRICSWQDQD
ncbi:hypothetical protein PFLUV_G00278380, partial [Perca fluviatilis]